MTLMTGPAPRVGAPDPEPPTFTILDKVEEFEANLELETGVCDVNGAPYPIRSCVMSGSDMRHCERRGTWIHTES